MDWRCDIYAYESERGIEIHVANRRHALDLTDAPPEANVLEDFEAWWRRHQWVTAQVQEAELVPIVLPCDGQSFVCEDVEDAVAKLRELVEMGYVMPEELLSVETAGD
jgi:hypothetical protein